MTLPKNLSFNSFLNVDYAPGQDPLIKRMAKKRKSAETETSGPSEAVDEGVGGLYKNASEWEDAAKSRGLVVKPATHPSGDITKYHIAKDKQGNNHGHFDHGTKTGRLKEFVEEVTAKQTPRWRVHVVTKDGVKFKSAAYTDKNQADKMHWKLAKGNKHRSVDLVQESVEVEEAVLNPAQRRMKALQMKRLAPKLRLGQERARARFADPERLKRRAVKAARTMIFRKLTKGIPKDELTYQRRQEIEKRLDSPAMKARIERIAIKMLPKERQQEVARHRQSSSDEKK